jgi:hypothetical protein
MHRTGEVIRGGHILEKAILLTARIFIIAGLLDLALLVITSVGVAAVGLSHQARAATSPSHLRGWMVACALLMTGAAVYLFTGAAYVPHLAILPDHLLAITRLSAAVVLFVSTGAALIFNLQSQRVFHLQNTANAAPVMGLHLLACCIAILSGNLLVIASAWIFITAAHHLQTSYPDGQVLAPLVAWRRWLISIIGDCGFLLVIALLAAVYHTTDLQTIYYKIAFLPHTSIPQHLRSFIEPLLIAVIFIKCAQFPFSYWLIPSRRDNTSWLNLQLSCGTPLVAVLMLLRLLPLWVSPGIAVHSLSLMIDWAALSAGVYAFAGTWQTDRFKAAFYMAVSNISLLLVLIGGGEKGTAEAGMMILFPSIFVLLFGLMLAAPLNRRPFYPSRRPGYKSTLASILIVAGCINLCLTPGFSASVTLGGVFAAVANAHQAMILPDLLLLWLTIALNTITGTGLIVWSLRGRATPAARSDFRPVAALPAPRPSAISTGILLIMGAIALFSCTLNLISPQSVGWLMPSQFAHYSGGGPTSLRNPAISMALGGLATVAGLVLGVFLQLAGKAAMRGQLAKVVVLRQIMLIVLNFEQFTAGAVVALLWVAGKFVAACDRLGLESIVGASGLIPHLIATAARRGLQIKGAWRLMAVIMLVTLTIIAASIATAVAHSGGW